MAAKVAKVVVDPEEVIRTKKLMDEMELKTLKRQERLMKYGSAKDAITGKQKKVIDALGKERDNLVSNLSVMQTERRCVMDAKQTKEITKLFAKGDSLDKEIAQEKEFIADLEAQIRKESAQLEHHRKNIKSNVIVSDFRLLKENKRVDRGMDGMKSRLHVEQVQLSVKIKENSELRKQIKVLLKSKANFNQLYEELVQKLNRGKTIMADIVAESKAQFLKRDEVARKIQALKDRDATDLRRRQEEMQDLEMRLAEDIRMGNFKQQVMNVRDKLSESVKATRKATLIRRAEEQRLKTLMDTWDTLKEETGLKESQEVCELLAKQEAENFSLFNYNNELRYQLESLTEKTAELMNKVEEQQEAVYHLEDEQESWKQFTEQKLRSVEEHEHDLSDSCEASNRLYDRLLSKTKTLFDMIECDPWPLEQLLGDNQEVNQFNCRLYLNMVEEKLLELMSLLPRKTSVHAVTSTGQTAAAILAHGGDTVHRGKSGIMASVPSRKLVSRPCPDCDEPKKRISD